MMSSLTLTIIQTDLHWENKAANLRKIEEKIVAIRERTEVVVLPEMFSTGFSMNPEALAETMDGETVNWMKRVAAQKKIILTGSLIIEENGNFYNRLIWMLPNGQFGVYDKRHRFGFAKEDRHYASGSRRLIASVKGWRVNLQICYDLRFPVWTRQKMNPEDQSNGYMAEYDLMIYVANWPEKRVHAWKTLLQARAIENQSYVVGVNRVGEDGAGNKYSGESMVVDPMGEILYIKKNEEDVFTITLDKEQLNAVREKFPFLKDADRFHIDE